MTTGHRCIELVEGLFLNGSRDLRSNAAKWFVFFDDKRAVCLADRIQNRFLIQGPNRAQVYNFSMNLVFSLQKFSCPETSNDCPSVTDETDIRPRAFDIRHAEGNEVFLLGNLPFFAIQEGI